MALASSPRSALSELRGKEIPRVFTPALRELTPETTLGFETIAFAEDVLEISLYPWQKWLLLHALELREGGGFRFRKVFVLVGRQNGKSTLLQVLSLWRMFVDGAALTVGTAQNLGIAREQWIGAVDMAAGVDDLKKEFKENSPTIQRGAEELELQTGERYKVVAGGRRGGRGLSVDLLLMDELREHQDWQAWSAISKTTNARPDAQIWAVSNAGDATSVVLRHFRKQAHARLGDPDGINSEGLTLEAPAEVLDDDEPDDSLGIFEWSAAPGLPVKDRSGWAQANPSMGYGALTATTLASDAASDPEWVYRTEVLCQWSEGTLEGPFPAGTWDEGRDPDSKRSKKSRLALGVDVSWDRSTAYIAVAAFRKDGKIHVELAARRAGTAWVVPWISERIKKLGIDAVAFQANGAPVSSLKDEAEKADLPIATWQGSDLGRWTGIFYDKVRAGQVFHLPQPPLDLAAAVAATRPAGDSWIWDRKNSPADIAPLVAVTAAVGALLAEDESFESAYATDDLMVV